MLLGITQFNLDLLTLGIGVAAIGVLGSLVYFNNRSSVTNQTFLLFCLATILWGISNFFEYKFSTAATTLIALRAHLFISVWHALLFFQLCFVFPKSSFNFPRWYRYVLVPAVFLVAVMTLTSFVFTGITGTPVPGVVVNPDRGPGLIVFSIVAFGLLFAGLSILLLKIFKHGGLDRRQHIYLFLGMSFTAALISAFNVVLPVIFANLAFIPFAALFMLPFVALTSYTMYRHRLFNLKVFAAGSLIFVLAALTFVEVIFTTDASLLIFRGAILLMILAAGIQLIKSVMKEIEQREHIQILAEELQRANDRLKELDTLKSQFLSIATHELRTPLTIVRNFISLMLDGTYGTIPAAAAEGGRQVFERVTDMARSVDTYLNVSRIEQGKMKYDFAEGNLTDLVKNAVAALKPNAEKKKLALTLVIESGAEALRAKMDSGKIKEVVGNLIDNSIKYTPSGFVTLSLGRAGGMARLMIKDSGVGMSPKTQANLFKLFSPGEDSKKINPASTGVGLYISRSHVEAHKGTLTAASAGEGKGSQFVLELPLLP